MFVKYVCKDTAVNLTELKLKANIVKHIDHSEIYFEFSHNFKLEDVPDDAIINILDNIENRL